MILAAFFSGRPAAAAAAAAAATLEMFPSWPIKFQQTPTVLLLIPLLLLLLPLLLYNVFKMEQGMSSRRREESTDESPMTKKPSSSSSSAHQGFIQKQIHPEMILTDVSAQHHSLQQKVCYQLRVYASYL